MLKAEQSDPDTFLISRDGSTIAGSIVRVGEQWRVEILWSGPGGDITFQDASLPRVLAFVGGVSAMMDRLVAR